MPVPLQGLSLQNLSRSLKVISDSVGIHVRTGTVYDFLTLQRTIFQLLNYP